MAATPYIPTFPYTGNQIILSSGRVTLHSKDDSIMMFGKKAIALSSLGTVNLDVANKVIINSPKIELGLNAEVAGEPVLLGKSTVLLITRMLKILIPLAQALNNMSESKLEEAIPALVKASKVVKKEFPQFIATANATGSLLSTVTFTK